MAEAAAAELGGVCVRPLPFRVHDRVSGRSWVVEVACGALVASKCPGCAENARKIRTAQCREGWHLEEEPEARGKEEQDGAGRAVKLTVSPEGRAERGLPARAAAGASTDDQGKERVVRSTRRRQDAAKLPRRRRVDGTLGRTYGDGNGRLYRPSMFLTLTLPSYGPVRDGVPVDPAAYEYGQAAADAMHFGKLVDRFVQNLRRVAGYQVQYFGVVEPQRRLAPHLHMAFRGTLPRRELRQIVAATYHQLWWPADGRPVMEGAGHPVWSEGAGYVDPVTGEVLPTWEEAREEVDVPRHVLRFGRQMSMRGVLVGSEEASKGVWYLAKYLTKSMNEALLSRWGALSGAEQAHAARLIEAVRVEPCSPECANWLRIGVQPKSARAGLRAGLCPRRAHRADRLGYGGRRVLVSRRWSGRRVSDYKEERRAWVLEALGAEEEEAAAEEGRYLWEAAKEGEEGVPPLAARVWRTVRQRRAAYEAIAKRREEAGRCGGEEARDAVE
ncbi:replication initiator [Nonomuraea sp. NPDC048892]|uniref:replication initiator n=1 Tax=Nonomuraea sp. NPDC048892 TaxID=3154624 RepID=UPI0033D1B4FC